MSKLLIARHGNTFDKGDTVTRVGLKTDLPLSQSGQAQAKQLGLYLKAHYPNITQVFCSELQRTRQTAEIALQAANINTPIESRALFNEIDYGIDENQPEENVIQRLGKAQLKNWDEYALLPDGWHLDIDKTKKALADFLVSLEARVETTLVITSNGIARFIPKLKNVTANDDLNLKLPTSAFGYLSFVNNKWQIHYWGRKPML